MFGRPVVASLLLFYSLSLKAQEKLIIKNVNEIYYRNTGAIMNGAEVKGYFTLYTSLGNSDNSTNYTLQILDASLKKIKDIQFKEDNSIQVLRVVGNSNAILVQLNNRKEKIFEYRIYDLEGKLKFKYAAQIEDGEDRYMIDRSYYTPFSKRDQNEFVFNVNDRAFITAYPITAGKRSIFEVDFLSAEKNQQWKYLAEGENDFKIQYPTSLGSTGTTAFFRVLKRKDLVLDRVHLYLLALDIETGKKIYEISTEQPKTKNFFFPMKASKARDTGSSIIIGFYADHATGDFQLNSLGLQRWKIDKEGKDIDKQQRTWRPDLDKFINIGSPACFHELIQKANGDCFLISEETFTRVGDIIIAQFDEKFNIKGAVKYDKIDNATELYPNLRVSSPESVAITLKSDGLFDYSFTTFNVDDSTINIGYTNYKKTTPLVGWAKGPININFHLLSFVKDDWKDHEIDFESTGESARFFPAKPGYVMVMEYEEISKWLNFYLQKID